MNIYLTGMMGSGKSVTGKRLAPKLGYAFLDLDEFIQERTHRSIPDIFAKEGEEFFRHEETMALKEAAAVSGRVIAAGGGTLLKPGNIDLMKQTGKIVFLETSPDILWDRVKDKNDRPLLKGENPKESLIKIYAYREPHYQSSCDFKVNTDGKTASAVADEIWALLRKANV